MATCFIGCLHQGLETRPNRQVCPTCKTNLNPDRIILIHGRETLSSRTLQRRAPLSSTPEARAGEERSLSRIGFRPGGFLLGYLPQNLTSMMDDLFQLSLGYLRVWINSSHQPLTAPSPSDYVLAFSCTAGLMRGDKTPPILAFGLLANPNPCSLRSETHQGIFLL